MRFLWDIHVEDPVDLSESIPTRLIDLVECERVRVFQDRLKNSCNIVPQNLYTCTIQIANWTCWTEDHIDIQIFTQTIETNQTLKLAPTCSDNSSLVATLCYAELSAKDWINFHCHSADHFAPGLCVQCIWWDLSYHSLRSCKRTSAAKLRCSHFFCLFHSFSLTQIEAFIHGDGKQLYGPVWARTRCRSPLQRMLWAVAALYET